MTSSEEEYFKKLGFNDDQMHAAEIWLHGINSIVMSSDPEHERKIREELGLKEDKRKSINVIKEPWMTRISGERQTGRTTELIKLCQKMNRDHGINDTVIVVADQKRAQCVSEMARHLGYISMPNPIPIHYATSQHMTGSYYKWALIDDVEYVLQTVLGNGGLQLRGYVEEE